MGTQVWAVVKSNSTPTQKDSSNTDGVFYLFYNKKMQFVLLLSQNEQ